MKYQRSFSRNVIDSRILNALEIIVGYLGSKDLHWTVMGSLSLALQGVHINPKDIDILTDEQGALQIGALLEEYEVEPINFSRTEVFESHYGLYFIEGVKVEVMGNLRVQVDGKWVPLSSGLKFPLFVQQNSLNIPVSPLRDQLLFYEQLGREKDIETILKIREVLK